MKKFLPYLLLATLGVLAVNLTADRLTPFTDNARVKAIVVPLIPQVSGYISEVAIDNYSLVLNGSTIFQIDPAPYEIAVRSAQAEFEQAFQDLGINAAEVAISQSNLVKTQVSYDNIKVQFERVKNLKAKGLVSQSILDDKRSELNQAKQLLDAANSALTKSKEELGSNGAENPKVKEALAKLEIAKLNLEWTSIKAPSNGTVVDLKVSEGTYAKASNPVMTFISGEDIWIDAYFTENNLGHVNIGDRVDIVLDAHPGEVFSGKVASLNVGASSEIFNFGSDTNVGLPRVPRMTGWMRDPQRFPVRVTLDNYETTNLDSDVSLRLNGQADIVIYTNQSNGFFDALAKAWICVLSYLSYAY